MKGKNLQLQEKKYISANYSKILQELKFSKLELKRIGRHFCNLWLSNVGENVKAVTLNTIAYLRWNKTAVLSTHFAAHLH